MMPAGHYIMKGMDRPRKKIAVVQSNYLPWKGYFDLIQSVDEFVLYDDVQYTKRDWRNRNEIKTPRGKIWLSIPVEVKGKFTQSIRETKIADRNWRQRHWAAVENVFRRAPQFEAQREFVHALFERCRFGYLSEVNTFLLVEICRWLGIRTPIRQSSEYRYERGEKNEQLAALCRAAGADLYVSGPAARSYLNAEVFARSGVGVSYFDYSGYPEYAQLYPPFDHFVSVLDPIFNLGAQAANCLRRAAGE